MAQNIVTAPQLDSASSLYTAWSADHEGDMDAFYTFMTTPSVERTQWLKSRTRSVSFDGPICITKFS